MINITKYNNNNDTIIIIIFIVASLISNGFYSFETLDTPPTRCDKPNELDKIDKVYKPENVQIYKIYGKLPHQ